MSLGQQWSFRRFRILHCVESEIYKALNIKKYIKRFGALKMALIFKNVVI